MYDMLLGGTAGVPTYCCHREDQGNLRAAAETTWSTGFLRAVSVRASSVLREGCILIMRSFSRLHPSSKDTSCFETILSYRNLVIIRTAERTVPNAIWLEIPQQVNKFVQNLDKQKPLDITDIKVQTMSKIVKTAGHNLEIIPSMLLKEADTMPTSQTGIWISWLYRFLATSLIRLGVGQHNQMDKRRLNEWKKISIFANTLVRYLKHEAGVSALRVYPLVAGES